MAGCTMRKIIIIPLFCFVLLSTACSRQPVASIAANAPNFLLIVTDDQSWMHTGIAGDTVVKTPTFDGVAHNGIYFPHAYAAAPTCTASRSALLAGQPVWRTGSGAVLGGVYAANLANYQAELNAHGYRVGFTGKGWNPGKSESKLPNPAGYSYQHKASKHAGNNTTIDYAQSFAKFLDDLKPGEHFSFIVTPFEPHRPYPPDAAKKGGIDSSEIVVPGFLPDTSTVRSDVANYLFAISSQDAMMGDVIAQLAKHKLLDNTVIVITSDNGMPFPRAKSNLYEYGVRVPLAIQWQGKIAAGQISTSVINLSNLAPTFLDLAGIPVPKEMSSRSARSLLEGKAEVKAEPLDWQATFTGFERHIKTARGNGQTYPMRAIHTTRYVYIHNFRPDLWPAGDPPGFEDIDNESPTKLELINSQWQPNIQKYLLLATQKRPAEEFYNLERDPFELNNLINDENYREAIAQLRDQLFAELRRTHDPIVEKGPHAFAGYP
jgi:N-sulfoglucosamine sulfohydrolase